MNEWGTSTPLTYFGDGTYAVSVALTAGTYGFKLASADWSTVNLGATSVDNATVTIGEALGYPLPVPSRFANPSTRARSGAGTGTKNNSPPYVPPSNRRGYLWTTRIFSTLVRIEIFLDRQEVKLTCPQISACRLLWSGCALEFPGKLPSSGYTFLPEE